MTTEQKLGERQLDNQKSKRIMSETAMLKQFSEKYKALEQERDEYKSDLDKAANRIVEVENQRDTLNLQNTELILKWKTCEAFAEGTINTLKEQLGIVENACQDWRDKAESAEAEVKRWEQAYEELDKSAKVMAEMRHEAATDAYNLQEGLAKARDLLKEWRSHGTYNYYGPVKNEQECADELENALGGDVPNRCETCNEVTKKSCANCGVMSKAQHWLYNIRTGFEEGQFSQELTRDEVDELAEALKGASE